MISFGETRALITPLVRDFSREFKSMLPTLSTNVSTTINSGVVIIFGIYSPSYEHTSHQLKASTFNIYIISYYTIHSNVLFCEFIIKYYECRNFIFTLLIWGTCTLFLCIIFILIFRSCYVPATLLYLTSGVRATIQHVNCH